MPRKQQLVCSVVNVNTLLKAQISSRSLRCSDLLNFWKRSRRPSRRHRWREERDVWMGGTLKCRQEKEEEPKSSRRGRERGIEFSFFQYYALRSGFWKQRVKISVEHINKSTYFEKIKKLYSLSSFYDEWVDCVLPESITFGLGHGTLVWMEGWAKIADLTSCNRSLPYQINQKICPLNRRIYCSSLFVDCMLRRRRHPKVIFEFSFVCRGGMRRNLSHSDATVTRRMENGLRGDD